jgi:hypothetical protein
LFDLTKAGLVPAFFSPLECDARVVPFAALQQEELRVLVECDTHRCHASPERAVCVSRA